MADRIYVALGRANAQALTSLTTIQPWSDSGLAGIEEIRAALASESGGRRDSSAAVRGVAHGEPPESGEVGDWPEVTLWRWHCGGELQFGELPTAGEDDLGFDSRRYIPAPEGSDRG